MPDLRVPARQRNEVKARAKHCCEYCLSQEEFSPDAFSVEHVTPLSKGGTNRLDNLANACQGCNNQKFVSTEAADPLTGEIVPLYHPRRDCWSEYFSWNHDYTLILGVSPPGRATVDKLDLNRKGVANLRRILRQIGLHPVT